MEKRNMKKANMNCPYFILLIVTSVLFTFLYQMKDTLLLPFPKENIDRENIAENFVLDEQESIYDNTSQEQSDSQGTDTENPAAKTDKPDDNQPAETIQESAVSEKENGSGETSWEIPPTPEEYLADTLFIGDSRTSSLMEYAGWDTAHFYVKYGLTIWDVLEAKIVESEEGKISVEEALQKENFGKIYIMLGINELGRGTAETFAEQYKKVVERIKQLQPESVIVVEAIMHVTAEKDAEGTYINNAEINARNTAIKKMAEEEGVCWLDVNMVTDDGDTGCLTGVYSFDGVHLKVKYLDVWKNFILENPF